jgi:hypothetical protein
MTASPAISVALAGTTVAPAQPNTREDLSVPETVAADIVLTLIYLNCVVISAHSLPRTLIDFTSRYRVSSGCSPSWV